MFTLVLFSPTLRFCSCNNHYTLLVSTNADNHVFNLSTVDSEVDLEKLMEHNESNSEPPAVLRKRSHDSQMTEVNCDATGAAAKKARKEDSRKKKEAKIAAAGKMAEDIFGADCMRCKVLKEELSAIKSKLLETERQLAVKDREVNDKEGQMRELQEELSDVTSSLQAKKAVVDTLQKQAEQANSSGELNRLHIWDSNNITWNFSYSEGGYSIYVLIWFKVS